jgi:Zn-finger nucleic acid-binding protein
MAHCPKCRFVELNEVDSGKGFTLDECSECGGRWFDMGELEKGSAHPEKVAQAKVDGPLRPRPSDRQCPRCEREMVNAGFINEFLRADLCQDGHGLWLDKHEIHLVDKLLAA